MRFKVLPDCGKITHIPRIPALFRNTLRKHGGGNRSIIRFPRCINIRDNDFVRVPECPSKFIKKVFCTGIGMRLEYAPELIMPHIPRR